MIRAKFESDGSRRAVQETTTWSSERRYLLRSPTFLVGVVVLVVYIIFAVFGPLLAPYPYTEFHLSERLSPPSMKYIFGTDQYGRDIFSRVLVGARDILVLAISATFFGLVFGTLAGLVAGYFGGVLDEVSMRLMDIMMSFPSLLLALLILSTLGSSLANLIGCIALIFVPRVARVVRSAVLPIKTQEYVLATRAIGASHFYIMFRTILPNISGPIIVEGTLRVSYAILIGASLSFLALGIQPPSPDWGLQVNEGRNFIMVAPWVILFPSVAISLLVLSVNFVADNLRHAFHKT